MAVRVTRRRPGARTRPCKRLCSASRSAERNSSWCAAMRPARSRNVSASPSIRPRAPRVSGGTSERRSGRNWRKARLRPSASATAGRSIGGAGEFAARTTWPAGRISRWGIGCENSAACQWRWTMTRTSPRSARRAAARGGTAIPRCTSRWAAASAADWSWVGISITAPRRARSRSVTCAWTGAGQRSSRGARAGRWTVKSARRSRRSRTAGWRNWLAGRRGPRRVTWESRWPARMSRRSAFSTKPRRTLPLACRTRCICCTRKSFCSAAAFRCWVSRCGQPWPRRCRRF